MKRLLVCLLLVGVVGCEQSESNKPISEVDKAISESNKAIKEFNKGEDFFKREDWDPAIACFTEAIRIDPGHADAYNNRGAAYRELGDQVKADADFAKSKKLGFDP